MPDKRSRKIVLSPQGGMTRGVVSRLKLILKLMGDRRVSPWVKLIPVGALVYLVSPVDIIMGIPGIAAVDDAAVLWLGSNLFVEMCPQDVVQEYMEELNMVETSSEDDVVDADSSDVNENK